ncbi:MAG: flagellar protein FlaG [Lachnospiraceae bacterium]|nr:flagellar protein FlaG [Lachnospiraceae bacterium]
MALEPINSVMSLQQQTYSAPKAVQPAEASEPVRSENTAATILEDVAVVENASAKGNADYQDNAEDQQTTPEQLKKAVEQLKKGQLENSEAVFGFHEETNRVTIKIVDKETKKVIKELPPEKTLDMIAKVWELAGLMVDEKR